MKKIDVLFQSGLEYVGSDDYPYTENEDGSINLVGKLFGIVNTHIPVHYIDYENGIPISTTICIYDGMPNRIYPDL